MIDGVTLKLGGEGYVVPPMGLKDMRRLKDGIASLAMLSTQGRDMTDDQWKSMIELVLTTLRRNYPNLTKEKVEDFLDLGNVGPLFQAIMNASGLEKTTVPLGEAMAPSELPTSIGPISSADSALT